MRCVVYSYRERVLVVYTDIPEKKWGLLPKLRTSPIGFLDYYLETVFAQAVTAIALIFTGIELPLVLKRISAAGAVVQFVVFGA